MGKENSSVSMYQIIGLGGALVSVMFGFMIAGGNPLALLHLSEMVMIAGFTSFSLLAIYRGDFLLFIPDALGAFFRRPKPSERFEEIARSGQRYAIASGILAFVLGMNNTMTSLIEGMEVVGYKIAASLTAIFLAIILSELIFGFLVKAYQKEDMTPTDKREKSLGLIYLIIFAVLGYCFVEYFLLPEIHSANVEILESAGTVEDASE